MGSILAAPGPPGPLPGGLPGALGASEGLQTSILVNFGPIWTHFGGLARLVVPVLESFTPLFERQDGRQDAQDASKMPS